MIDTSKLRGVIEKRESFREKLEKRIEHSKMMQKKPQHRYKM